MKKIFWLLIAGYVVVACTKEKQAEKPTVDYSQYKLKSAINKRTSISAGTITVSYDTSSWVYNDTEFKCDLKSDGIVRNITYAFNNGLYTQTLVTNGNLSQQRSYFTLTPLLYLDSTWTVNNSSVIQAGKNLYNSDGSIAVEFTDYKTYQNTNRYVHLNGNAVYSINERKSLNPGIANAKDSVVYEFYPDMLYRAPYYYSGIPTSFFGKPNKNLVKKATYFDLLNNNKIRVTREYSYKTDAVGLVTYSTLTIYTQPGNILGYSDTTTYTYYNR